MKKFILKADIKGLEKQIPQAERDLKMLTNRGKLELLLADDELIGILKERWIAAEVAKRLDYPIFMAVSERGGKDNSGDYEYVVDEHGSLNHLTFCQRGKQPVYSNTGFRVINSKQVQPNRVIFEDNRLAISNPNDALQIRYGDTLINGKGRGTLGRAAPYLFDESAVPDNHVTILRSPDLDPVYLSLYLNSAAGQMQVEMYQRGTSGQLELYPFDIRRFLVWPAPESFQKELRRIHDKAASAERESRQLLEQAKARVEQLIEEAAQA